MYAFKWETHLTETMHKHTTLPSARHITSIQSETPKISSFHFDLNFEKVLAYMILCKMLQHFTSFDAIKLIWWTISAYCVARAWKCADRVGHGWNCFSARPQRLRRHQQRKPKSWFFVVPKLVFSNFMISATQNPFPPVFRLHTPFYFCALKAKAHFPIFLPSGIRKQKRRRVCIDATSNSANRIRNSFHSFTIVRQPQIYYRYIPFVHLCTDSSVINWKENWLELRLEISRRWWAFVFVHGVCFEWKDVHAVESFSICAKRVPVLAWHRRRIHSRRYFTHRWATQHRASWSTSAHLTNLMEK